MCLAEPKKQLQKHTHKNAHLEGTVCVLQLLTIRLILLINRPGTTYILFVPLFQFVSVHRTKSLAKVDEGYNQSDFLLKAFVDEQFQNIGHTKNRAFRCKSSVCCLSDPLYIGVNYACHSVHTYMCVYQMLYSHVYTSVWILTFQVF